MPIEDIIEGILRILDRPASGNTRWNGNLPDPGTSLAPWRIYNIGNNQPVELLEYVRAIEDSIGKRAVIELLPIQPGDVPDTHANVEDLINQFDYKPATTIEDGVKLFVDWYRNYYRFDFAIMKISVFGTGYVGLVSGACLAEVGHNVVCVDKDQNKLEKLNNGIIPIWEPGLEGLIERNVMAGRLKFTTDHVDAVQHGQVQFIAVGTPADEDGSADLRYVLEVAEDIALCMSEYKVIVNKSTVPVGTAFQTQSKVLQILKNVEKTFLLTLFQILNS